MIDDARNLVRQARDRSTLYYTWPANLDWRYRAGYLPERHGVSVEQANEALADPDALMFDPDYASQSGRSVRTVGWSPSAGRLLTVITVEEDGVVYGVNGWPANDADSRRYEGKRDE